MPKKNNWEKEFDEFVWGDSDKKQIIKQFIQRMRDEIAKDLERIWGKFPEDSPGEEWWKVTDELYDYIEKLKKDK